ncbi:hypothetical protein BTA51_12700 [Hahella sp. CCB-MM4]|uniref:hypothetical protein n=1 Tax=Hahella sp. (strain CCB-MM4) TaxID=1926491 RepID=UPI000BDCDFA7|nr:hypothetical protein [Hahella sp. CCB-MM4]OZG72832.1 hypothetical protein BTA51_12700 [Hahella sp. CCB-MM4]
MGRNVICPGCKKATRRKRFSWGISCKECGSSYRPVSYKAVGGLKKRIPGVLLLAGYFILNSVFTEVFSPESKMGEFAIKLILVLFILTVAFVQNPKLVPRKYVLISDVEKTTKKVDKFALVLGGILAILCIAIMSKVSDLV